MKTLGLRHLALRVKNIEASLDFYQNFLAMQIEWQPDPDNVYLSSDKQDNLALHREDDCEDDFHEGKSSLDHLGFFVESQAMVNQFYRAALDKKYEIAKEPKEHRDGAYSFYLKDPSGNVVQIIWHPEIPR